MRDKLQSLSVQTVCEEAANTSKVPIMAGASEILCCNDISTARNTILQTLNKPLFPNLFHHRRLRVWGSYELGVISSPDCDFGSSDNIQI